MDFFEMVIRLKIIHENKIIIISCGAFFIAIGEDAVILNKKLNLKVNRKQCSIINIKCLECSKNNYNTKTDYEIALDRYIAEEVGE